MPKRNLIWIAVIVGAGVATVLLTRPAPQPDDPDVTQFGPVMRARHVLRQYSYEAPPEARMQQGAVRGMVETFDEYSSYIPPERVKSFRARLNGQMICTGLVLAGEGDGPAEVVGSLPDSPAHPPVPRPAHLQPAMPFFTPADRPAPWNRPCGHVIIGVG